MSDLGQRPGSARVLAIGEVTAKATVIKCMGRTYAAVAVNNEVRITDTTDITHPIRLGSARAKHGNGVWDIVTDRNDLVTTTQDLLCAVTALREKNTPAPLPTR